MCRIADTSTEWNYSQLRSSYLTNPQPSCVHSGLVLREKRKVGGRLARGSPFLPRHRGARSKPTFVVGGVDVGKLESVFEIHTCTTHKTTDSEPIDYYSSGI